ncbi:hypothetical protein ACH5RR_015725 [Cinchona calisaya]|uniref:Uncharacterized protein n=1 Tax=Cinchona calisaya TaxID=153742 RepID=A0ABD2ZTZ8_9GENT
MLDEVDAKLHYEELMVKNSNISTNVSNLDTTANASSVKFKGIKRKTKTLSGKRLKTSLEKATKRKRAKNNDSSSNVIVAPSMSSHNEFVHLDFNQRHSGQPYTFSSMNMTNLLQAQQLCGFGGLQVNNSEFNSNSINILQEFGANYNNSCGCPVPCSGGISCKLVTAQKT